MAETKRDYQIDNIKGILIILVVIGHSLETLRTENLIANGIYHFIYLFHMPVFIFISGYLSKNLQKGRDTAVENFLIPFLVINGLFNLDLLLANVRTNYSFFIPGWTLWYLLSMFIWKMLLPDILRVRHILGTSIVFGALAGLFTELDAFMALSRTITFAPYFIAGYLMSRDQLQVIQQRRLGRWWCWLAVLFVAGLSGYLSIQERFPVEFLWNDRPYVRLEIHAYFGVFVSLLKYGIGFLFVYVFLCLTMQRESFLSRAGRNSLSVYLLHIYLIAVLLGIGSLVAENGIKLILYLVGSVVIVLLLSSEGAVSGVRKLLGKINHFIYGESG